MLRLFLAFTVQALFLVLLLSLESVVGWPVLSFSFLFLMIVSRKKETAIIEFVPILLFFSLLLGTLFNLYIVLTFISLLAVTVYLRKNLRTAEKSLAVILAGVMLLAAATVLFSPVAFGDIDKYYLIIGTAMSVLIFWRVFGVPLLFKRHTLLQLGRHEYRS